MANYFTAADMDIFQEDGTWVAVFVGQDGEDAEVSCEATDEATARETLLTLARAAYGDEPMDTSGYDYIREREAERARYSL